MEVFRRYLVKIVSVFVIKQEANGSFRW